MYTDAFLKVNGSNFPLFPLIFALQLGLMETQTGYCILWTPREGCVVLTMESSKDARGHSLDTLVSYSMGNAKLNVARLVALIRCMVAMGTRKSNCTIMYIKYTSPIVHVITHTTTHFPCTITHFTLTTTYLTCCTYVACFHFLQLFPHAQEQI